MKIENNNKVQLLDHLVKSANAKAPKQGTVGQKDNQQQTKTRATPNKAAP